MKIPAIIGIIALLIMPFASALAPSEIHYNPVGDDNGLEFVEFIGTEDLTGCVVRDSASADTLELLQPAEGSDLILIVESDGAYANLTTNAAVYGAGKAIGNGLGNAADSITITCTDAELLTIAYNISSLPDIPDGASIIYDGTSWIAGIIGGTPGTQESNTTPPPTPQPTPPPTPQPPKPTPNGGGGGIPLPEPCNTTLLFTVGATEGAPGDVITFSVISEEYASWEAITDARMIAFGDTITGRTHAVELPTDAEEVRLIAESRACGGRQRATRYITVLKETKNDTPPIIVTQESTIPIAASPQPPTPPPITEPIPTPKQPDVITANVIVDEDLDAIPWISGFAIVTVLASVTVFLVLHRRENAQRTDAKHIRTPTAQASNGSERQDSEGTSQEGMVASDRDIRSGGST